MFRAIQRGIHSINDEITYASNPGFVFHDSGGFEAGAIEEVDVVWNFIRERSAVAPSQHLHAIWYAYSYGLIRAHLSTHQL